VEEALCVFIPWQDRGVVPFLLSFGDGESPIEKVAKMGQDLAGSANFFSRPKIREPLGRTTERFAAAVGKSRKRMPQEPAGGIGVRA
jgi:hypothetical protein